MESRTAVPSEFGVSPRSDFMIAFSMSCRIVFSQGVIMSMRGSGTAIAATWLTGVGCP